MTVKRQVLLGIDVGSSACKVAAVNNTGHLISTGETGYPTHYPQPGWAVQHPADWINVTCQSVRSAMSAGQIRPDEIAGISVTGPAHCVALLDDYDKVVYPTIHYSDLRSVPQSARLKANSADLVFSQSLQQPNPSWTLSHLLWLKESEPGVWKKLRKILPQKDYVRSWLTGDYLTDPYDAIGTQLFDALRGSWSSELCAIAPFAPENLPEVKGSLELAGRLLPVPAAQLGLLPGIPVAVGSGDSVIEAFGAGVVNQGQATIKLATTANVTQVHTQVCPSPQVITYTHVIPDVWVSIAATNAGASSLKWLRSNLLDRELLPHAAETSLPYTQIETMAARVPAGCEGLIFHPYLNGERTPHWDPDLRGSFLGISSRHQLQHFLRAVMEGVAFSLRDCLETSLSLGDAISDLRIIGGGARISLWRQILCDVIGMSLQKPMVEDAAFGAALLAGVTAGVFENWQQAVRGSVQVVETHTPQSAAHRTYTDYFRTYQDAARSLASINHQLVKLSNQ